MVPRALVCLALAATLPAQLTWATARVLKPRGALALAYDSLRGRAVLFGGATVPAPASDTWEWGWKLGSLPDVCRPWPRRARSPSAYSSR